MTNEFNADEFCKSMQLKAKQLSKTAKQLHTQRTHKGTVTLIINGKKIIHTIPCIIENCIVCKQIDKIQSNINNMITEMDLSLIEMFTDLFGY